MDFRLAPPTWAGSAAAGAAPPVPAAAGPGALPAGWKEEMLAEAGGAAPRGPKGGGPGFVEPPGAPPGWVPPPIDPGSIRARPSPLSLGERKLVPPAARREGDPPAIPGWRPGQRPPDQEAYRALLTWTWRPELEALALAIMREPLFAYAARRWRPGVRGTRWWEDAGALASNLEILNVLYDRLSALMATYWDFDPAPLAHVPNMGGNFLGLYFPHAQVIAVSTRLLGAPLFEVVDTIAHEQTHALQGRLLRAPQLAADGYEASLVAYWAHELPRLRRIRYEDRGIEIHAFQVGGVAAAATRRLG